MAIIENIEDKIFDQRGLAYYATNLYHFNEQNPKQILAYLCNIAEAVPWTAMERRRRANKNRISLTIAAFAGS